MINIESRKKPVDTLETRLLGIMLKIALTLFTVFLVYHACYELLPNLFPGDWSLALFGYTVSDRDGLLIAAIDVTIRDITPICLLFASLFLASTWITKRYKLTPLRNYSEELCQLIADLEKKTKIGFHKSYMIPTSIANAFVFGIRKANLVLTSGILSSLEKREIQAVISHELGHVLDKDVGLMTWGEVYSKALILFFPIIFIYEIVYNLWLGGPVWVLLIRLTYISVFIFLIPLTLFNSVSRAREFLADARVSLLMGTPHPLESALINMQVNNRKHRLKVPFPTHLSIIPTNIAKNNMRRKLSFFLSSHPPTKERLLALDKGRFLYKETKFPTFGLAGWIGIITASTTGFLVEFLREIVKNFMRYNVWVKLQTSTGWWSYLETISNHAVFGFPQLVLSVFFMIYFRKHIRIYWSTLLYEDELKIRPILSLFVSYFRQVWKSFGFCIIIFALVYIPLAGYFGYWGFNFILGGSIQYPPSYIHPIGTLPPTHCLYVIFRYIACLPLLTVILLLIFTITLGALAFVMQKEVVELTKSVSRSFIKAEFSEELPFFEKIWQSLEKQKISTKEERSKNLRERYLKIVPPETLGSLVTPFVISLVSSILSGFLIDFVKGELKQKKIEKGLREEIHAKAVQIAADFSISKDLASKTASFTIEYIEQHR